MGICSMILHAQPKKLQALCNRIELLEGVEVHAVSEKGKLVLCVDLPDPLRYSKTLMQLHNLPDVLSATLVYEFNEEPSITHREVPT